MVPMLFTPTNDKTGRSSDPAPERHLERITAEQASTLTLTNSDCKPWGRQPPCPPASCHPLSWQRLTTQIHTHSKLGKKSPYKKVPFLATPKKKMSECNSDSHYEDNSGVPQFLECVRKLNGRRSTDATPMVMAQSRKSAPAIGC